MVFPDDAEGATGVFQRMVSFDGPLWLAFLNDFDPQKVADLLRLLQANADHRLKFGELIVKGSGVTADALFQLLPFFCRSRPTISSEEVIPLPTLPAIRISSHDQSADVCERLFDGMIQDQPPGLADLQSISVVNGCIDWRLSPLNNRRWNEPLARLLRKVLSSAHCGLKALKLNYIHMTDATMHLLASGALSSHCVLERLDLLGNSIGDVGAEQIARMLSHTNSKLKHLDLNRNQIGDVGAVALGAALRHRHRQHSCLEWLDVSYNRIGDVGVVAMTKGVASHPTLKRWYIAHNPITQQGYDALTESIPHLLCLQVLYLGPLNCQPPQQGRHQERPRPGWLVYARETRQELQQSLRHNLQSLQQPQYPPWERQLRHDTVTIEMIQLLASGMQRNHALELLYLPVPCSTNNPTYICWEMFRAMLKDVHSVFVKSDSMEELLGLCSYTEDFLILDSVLVTHFFTSLNLYKLRGRLFDELCVRFWPFVLERVRRVPSLLFYLVREKPELVRFLPSPIGVKRARLEPAL